MLKIYINNQQVPLPADISITVKRESSFFSEDTIAGDFAINISIVKNDFTARLLGYPDRLSAVRTSQENVGRIEFSGIVLMDGSAKLEESINETYEGYISGSIGLLGASIKDKTIKDYEYGGVRNISDLNKSETFPRIDWTCFPVTNAQFFEGRFPADEDGNEVAVNAQVNKFVNGSIAKDPLDNYCVVSPFPYLAYIIEQIFIEEGFTIARNDLREDALLKKLVLYTNWNIKRVVKTETIIWMGGGYITSELGIDSFKIADLFPKDKVKKFILGIRQDLNIDFFIENKTVNIILKDKILLNPNYNDLTLRVIGKTPVDLKKEIKGYVFAQSINSDDLMFEKREDVSLHKGIVGEAVNALEDLPAWITGNWWEHNIEIKVKVGELRFVKNERSWYKWVVNKDNETIFGSPYIWEKYSVNYQNAKFGEQADAEEIESYFSPIFALAKNTEPKLSIKGCGAIYEDENKTKPSLLIYEGEKNNVPFGSSWTDELALDYDSENNILDKYHREIIDFMINRRADVSCEVDLSPLEFRSLDMSEKQRIKGIDHLIKSVEMTFKIKSYELCQLELAAILPPKFDHLTLSAAVPYVPPVNPPSPPSVSPKQLFFSWLGDSQVITITTSESWIIEVLEDWIRPSIMSGIGNAVVSVHAARRRSDNNSDKFPREGGIKIIFPSSPNVIVIARQRPFGGVSDL